MLGPGALCDSRPNPGEPGPVRGSREQGLVLGVSPRPGSGVTAVPKPSCGSFCQIGNLPMCVCGCVTFRSVLQGKCL